MTQLEDRTPSYSQVVQSLRKKIIAGDLPDKTPLSAHQISDDYQISQGTALRVLATLRSDGLAEGEVETTVRAGKTLHRSPRDRFSRMLATGRIYAPGEYAKITSTGLAPVRGQVADALEVWDGASAAFRHRITFNEDGPVSASTSWFTLDLVDAVPALLARERIPGGTPRAIQAATGRIAARVEDRLSVACATSKQAADLGIPEGSPVLFGYDVLRDTDDEVIQVGEYVSGPGRWTHHNYDLS